MAIRQYTALEAPPCQGGSVKRANLLGAAFYTVFSHCQKWQNQHNKNNGLQVGFGLSICFSLSPKIINLKVKTMEYLALFLYLCGGIGMYIHLNEDNPPGTQTTYLLDIGISLFWFIGVLIYLGVTATVLLEDCRNSSKPSDKA